jgi:hypothetical protein
MRKTIIAFAIALLLAGTPMLDVLAATTPTAPTGGTTGVQNAPYRAPIINGRRAGKNIKHFRHKNRSMEPAADNQGATPGSPGSRSPQNAQTNTGGQTTSGKHWWQ